MEEPSPQIQEKLPEALTSPAEEPSTAPVPVPVETVSEAWEERRHVEEDVPAASVQVEDVSLELRNNTDYDVDFTALPPLPEGLDFTAAEPVILIVHTHTTESYLKSGEDPSEAVYRALDEDDGVMAVGDAMAAVLEARGYRVLHDKTLCDYPEYNGAYNRSRAVIQADLAEYPSICLVLDVHRDAVADSDGNQLRMAAEAEGQDTAQVMLVVGTDDGGLEHPDWRQNLSLAAVLQGTLNAACPCLIFSRNASAHTDAGRSVLAGHFHLQHQGRPGKSEIPVLLGLRRSELARMPQIHV